MTDGLTYATENLTILTSLLKFYGRDVNLIELYRLFEAINKDKYEKDEIRGMYLSALANLKMMGVLANSK